MKKLFIGNLAFAIREDALKGLFSQAGQVESVAVILDKMSGRSKGFAFVEMSSKEEAQKAIAMFNGYELEGRNIFVGEARPPENRPRSNFSSNRR